MFHDGRYSSALERFEAAIPEDPRNAVLNHCRAASAALARGDDARALRHLLSADVEMEDLTAAEGETTAVVLQSEDKKRWKGEPFERAMVSIYGGLCYWRQGNIGNALAGFKNAMIRDSDVREDAYKADVPLHWILAGRAYLRLGQTGQAAEAFAKATELAPKNPFAKLEAHKDANVLIVADLGDGPIRERDGRHGQIAVYRKSWYPEGRVRITVDGAVVGTAARSADLYREATTRGERGVQGILDGKAIFKDGTTIGGAVILTHADKNEHKLIGAGLLALGLLTSAEADVRYWETLPGEIHLWSGRLEPGVKHEIRVETLDSDGKTIRGARIYRATLELRAGDDRLLYVRSGPGTESDLEPKPGGDTR